MRNELTHGWAVHPFSWPAVRALFRAQGNDGIDLDVGDQRNEKPD